MLAPTIIDVIQLAVKQIGLPDGTNVHLLAYPGGAAAGNFLLLQAIGQLQPFVFDLERFLVSFVWIKRGDESWLTKEKVQVLDAVKLSGQRFISVDGEVGRDNRQMAAGIDLLDEKIGDLATGMVVANAETVWPISCHRASSRLRLARHHYAPNRQPRRP